MKKTKAMVLFAIFLALVIGAWAQHKAPLKLAQAISLPDLHDGDFDHFRVDLAGRRLFATAEENSKVLVFDLKTNKLIHTISDLKAPHSMVYRADLKKLFVVDGDLGEVRIYDTESFKQAGQRQVTGRRGRQHLRSREQIYVRGEWRRRRPSFALLYQRD